MGRKTALFSFPSTLINMPQGNIFILPENAVSNLLLPHEYPKIIMSKRCRLEEILRSSPCLRSPVVTDNPTKRQLTSLKNTHSGEEKLASSIFALNYVNNSASRAFLTSPTFCGRNAIWSLVGFYVARYMWFRSVPRIHSYLRMITF